MNWIYLSPHLDDVALSCGGWVWEQTKRGETVSIWTVCAGDPPAGAFSPFAQRLHERWQTGPEAVASRRLEDLAACAVLGASARHLDVPDCIYRMAYTDQAFLYDSEEKLFGLLDEREQALVDGLAGMLSSVLPADAAIACPLALGGHVDHRLTRAAAERLDRQLWYYADYPYALVDSSAIVELESEGAELHSFPVSDAGLEAWTRAVAAHASQISTFWSDLDTMRLEIRWYYRAQQGVRVWRRR